MPSNTLTTLPYYGAGMILLNEDDHVLILQDHRAKKWSFPKGAPEVYDYEQPLLTAKRECEEECGLQAGDDYDLLDWKPVIHFNRFFYFGRMKPGAETRIKLQETEICAYQWLNPRKSCDYWMNLNSGVRHYMKVQRGFFDIKPRWTTPLNPCGIKTSVGLKCVRPIPVRII